MSKVFTGQTVTFQALASTPGFSESAHSYSWNVDGTISGTNPTTASFATSGLHPATVTATNTITGGTATARTDVEVIDNGWSSSLACPYQMYAPTYAVLPNGNLFVCGDVSEYATCWETDGSSWVNRGTNPRPRNNENTNKNFIYPALNDGRIMVVGGRNSSHIYTTNTDFYDPSSNTWSSGPVTSRDHRYLNSIFQLSDGRVMVLGGEPSATERPEFYDPDTDSWSTGSAAPYQLALGLVMEIGTDVFLATSSAYTNRVVTYNAATDTWGAYATLPSGVTRGLCSGHGVSNKVYIFGMSGALNKAVIYDLVANTCSTGTATFGSAFYGKCYLFNGGIWLDRMRSSDGSYSALYLPDSDTYIGSAKLSGTSSVSPFAGSNYFSATVGGKPFVFGSYDDSSSPYQVATIYSTVL